MTRTHGGRWADYLQEHGVMPLDFSSNTSPLGMPEAARVAAVDALDHANRYPDPACRELRRAIAKRHGLGEDMVLAGNGAGDLIDRLALALRPRHAMVTAPTFGEYRVALERVGCGVEEHVLSRELGFSVDEGLLDRIDSRLDVLVLCEPNNPTGRTCEPALLQRIVERCDEAGTWLVADECFADFLDDPKAHSLLGAIPSHRILMLRAFTKFYGMAGLRLGWCTCADRTLLRDMADAGQPWPVSSIAQAAGIAALEDEDYARQVRTLVRAERVRIRARLEALGLHVIAGEANYLLFFDEMPRLTDQLARMGILIRDCSDYSGLGRGWYRVAIRMPHENDRLLAALEVTHA